MRSTIIATLLATSLPIAAQADGHKQGYGRGYAQSDGWVCVSERSRGGLPKICDYVSSVPPVGQPAPRRVRVVAGHQGSGYQSFYWQE